MIKFNARLATAIATAAVIMGAVAPAAFADTAVIIDGNGANSNNVVTVSNSTGTKVVQSNSSEIGTSVDSSASTGGNTASGNTGGDNTIVTGNASSTVNVTVGGSSNTATVTPTCGCDTTTTVAISGNGKNSNNGVVLTSNNWFKVIQKNWSSVITQITSLSKTGHNKSNSNVGGSNTIITGGASSHVTVNVTGSTNTLNQ